MTSNPERLYVSPEEQLHQCVLRKSHPEDFVTCTGQFGTTFNLQPLYNSLREGESSLAPILS